MITKNSYFRKRAGSSSQNVIVGLVFTFIFVGVIGFLVFQNIAIYQKRSALEKKAEQLRAQIKELENQNTQIQATIQIDQGQQYQEKVLREQGLYKKPGEQVITVLPQASQQQVQTKENKKPWWASLQNVYDSIIGK